MSTGDPRPALAEERVAVAARSADLARQLAVLAEEQALTTADDEHDPDGTTVSVMRAQVQGLLDGARRERAALDRADARLRAGTYGRCLRCDRPIAAARLDALPAAETCIACTGRR